AEDLPGEVADVARPDRFRPLLLQETAVVIIRDKTDLLALGSPGARQVPFPGQRPDLFLLVLAKGKKAPCQLLLGEAEQDVALVFFWVCSPGKREPPYLRVIPLPDIMTGGEITRPQLPGFFRKSPELYLRVT